MNYKLCLISLFWKGAEWWCTVIIVSDWGGFALLFSFVYFDISRTACNVAQFAINSIHISFIRTRANEKEIGREHVRDRERETLRQSFQVPMIVYTLQASQQRREPPLLSNIQITPHLNACGVNLPLNWIYIVRIQQHWKKKYVDCTFCNWFPNKFTLIQRESRNNKIKKNLRCI